MVIERQDAAAKSKSTETGRLLIKTRSAVNSIVMMMIGPNNLS